jgi:ElaB/YqjD/DUF883 family membrane-anchored ribosome-binding protein
MGEETARLRDEIDRTRENLTRDVDLLADKTSPGRVVERKMSKARTGLRRGMSSLRERVMGSPPSRPYGHGPAHADEIHVPPYGTTPGAEVESGSVGTGERLSSAGASAADAAKETAGKLQGTASQARDQVTHAGEQTQRAAHEAVSGVRGQTEGNPIAAGVVAFGIGWLVSSLIPSSQAEEQAALRARDVTREHGGPMLDEAKQAAAEVGQNLKDEAKEAAQHLKEHAQEAGETVKAEGTKGTAARSRK